MFNSVYNNIIQDNQFTVRYNNISENFGRLCSQLVVEIGGPLQCVLFLANLETIFSGTVLKIILQLSESIKVTNNVMLPHMLPVTNI